MVFIEHFKEMVLYRGCFEIVHLGCFNKLTTISNSEERKSETEMPEEEAAPTPFKYTDADCGF